MKVDVGNDILDLALLPAFVKAKCERYRTSCTLSSDYPRSLRPHCNWIELDKFLGNVELTRSLDTFSTKKQ